MSDTDHTRPMLAKSADASSATSTSHSAVTAPPKAESPATRSPLDMKSARALAECIRSKLKGRPRGEDSTTIIRQLRDA